MFCYIHPFIDGNGRTARLYHKRILYQFGYPIPNIPIQQRNTYINLIEDALRAVEIGNWGKTEDFFDYMLERIDESLNVILNIGECHAKNGWSKRGQIMKNSNGNTKRIKLP